MKEHIFNIHDVVLLMTVAECILLALFQAMLPVKDRIYGYLLSAFLLIIATVAGATLMLWSDADLSISPTFDQYLLPYFLMVPQMLKGPALFLYVVSITQRDFRLRLRHLIHLLPAAVCALTMLIFGVDTGDLRLFLPDEVEGPDPVVTYLWDSAKIVPLVYVARR
jgi:hypothetical protein